MTKPVQGLGVLTFDATYDTQLLAVPEIEQHYGKEAADRSRTDRRTLQLCLRRSMGIDNVEAL